MPVESGPSRWAFPPADGADEDGLVGVGADLEPATVLAAYRRGLFPMPVGGRGLVGWWSPDPRAVIPLDGLRISRSLRRSLRRYEIRVDTAFDDVLDACADPTRPHGWISADVRTAYQRLHDMGWVHSVEAWDVEDGALAGGLYGVAIGGLFAGESMFHRRTDGSKAALVGLVDLLREGDGNAAGSRDGDGTAVREGPGEGHDVASGRVLDVQWMTPHLATLGAVEIPRDDYIRRVAVALTLPLPPVFRLRL